MPKKRVQRRVKPSSDPNVAAFNVVAKLTGAKPTKKPARSKRKPAKKD